MSFFVAELYPQGFIHYVIIKNEAGKRADERFKEFSVFLGRRCFPF